MIIYKENNITVEEFNYLYDVVKWGHYDNLISEKALNNTIYSVSAYDDEQIVGFGRIIGDGAIFIYIHDVMVVPEYQSKKIGSEIVNKLLEKIEELRKFNPDVRVYLGASKGKEEFYKKFGFVTRKEADLGEGMILK